MSRPRLRRAAGSKLRGAPLAILIAALAGACTGAPTETIGGADAGGADAGETAAMYEGFASYHPYDDVPGINVACSPAASTEFDPKNFDLMVTALQDLVFDQLGKAVVCHKCAAVTSLPQAGGNGRSVTVRIIDRTQDHTSNGGHRYLDLAPQAFALIGDIAKGFIPVRFAIVDCPASLR
jgi:expansin (peptidoglycan-binding protein)